jgi:hypothetical protein
MNSKGKKRVKGTSKTYDSNLIQAMICSSLSSQFCLLAASIGAYCPGANDQELEGSVSEGAGGELEP